MSDTVLLIAGTIVFAFTTATTLLYGYLRFAAVYRQDSDPEHRRVDVREVYEQPRYNPEAQRR